MRHPVLTKTIYNDAGLLREYVVRKYGQVLTYGGDGKTLFRALKLIIRLSTLTGEDVRTVHTDILADSAHLDEVEDKR